MNRHLILVRHAETTWHVEHRMQGRADPPLTATGEAQAAQLRVALEGFTPTSVVTSDLGRAMRTAELAGYPDARPDPAWAESDFGAWQGRTAADVRASADADHQAWRIGRFDPPGGEPWTQLCARVSAAATSLPAGVHLVITHGGVIRALLATLLGIDLRRLVPVECGHVVVVEVAETSRLVAYDLSPSGFLPGCLSGRMEPDAAAISGPREAHFGSPGSDAGAARAVRSPGGDDAVPR